MVSVGWPSASFCMARITLAGDTEAACRVGERFVEGRGCGCRFLYLIRLQL